MNKQIATAIITDPTAVAAACAARTIEYHNGSIFCTIPELGFLNQDMIYCRYGLSIPYLRIQPNWRVLVEPTVGDRERWFYTGLVDGVTATTSDQLIIQLLTQVIYASTANTMHLSSKTASKPFVLGDNLLTWIQNFITNYFNAHTHSSGGSGPPIVPASAPTDILSTSIFGE